LDDAFSTLLGAILGLLIGGAIAGYLARGGSRLLTGSAAGVVAYTLVLAPLFVITRPNDVGIGESLVTTLVFAVPVCVWATVGAAVGALVVDIIQRPSRRRNSATAAQ
jgi:hypothetical protein